MSETGNIEELAKLVSNEIFKWFKWNTCPLKDTDWQCVIDSHEKKTHPADVVFDNDALLTAETGYSAKENMKYLSD